MTKEYEPFDLERALAGDPVILRDGRKAYVRHHEKTLTLRQDGRPLLGYRIYDGLAVEASWGPDGLWLKGREFPKDIVGMYPQYRLVNGVKVPRSEEHTSELQSRGHLVCRLLLEKKNRVFINDHT